MLAARAGCLLILAGINITAKPTSWFRGFRIAPSELSIRRALGGGRLRSHRRSPSERSVGLALLGGRGRVDHRCRRCGGLSDASDPPALPRLQEVHLDARMIVRRPRASPPFSSAWLTGNLPRVGRALEHRSRPARADVVLGTVEAATHQRYRTTLVRRANSPPFALILGDNGGACLFRSFVQVRREKSLGFRAPRGPHQPSSCPAKVRAASGSSGPMSWAAIPAGVSRCSRPQPADPRQTARSRHRGE